MLHQPNPLLQPWDTPFGLPPFERFRPGRQQLRHERNRLRAGDPRLLHIRIIHLGDAACAVGHAVQVIVVKGEQNAVSRGMNIGLDIAVAEIDRTLKGWHRVFRPCSRAAAMRKGKQPVMLEKGKLRRTHGVCPPPEEPNC